MWFLASNITLQSAVLTILALLVIIFMVFPLREFLYSCVAYRLGDNTAKYSGRMTLNPLQHIDVLGAASLLLFGIGWSNNVPIDNRNFKNPKLGTVLVSITGPIVHALAALLALIFMNITELFCESMPIVLFTILVQFFTIYASINISLAAFSLLPIPPFGGYKILEAFLPQRLTYQFYAHYNYITLVIIVLLFMGFFTVPLTLIRRVLLGWLNWLADLPFMW